MDDTKKMLQAIINGQSALKSELLGEIQKVDKKVDRLDEKVDGLKGEMIDGFKKLTARVDKIGSQAAHLEDDTPTVQEVDELEKRVTNLENQIKN